MSAIEEKVRGRLFAMQDKQYQVFQQKLLPSLPPEAVIGVRTPDLRRYARELAGSGEVAAFLAAAPHRYYEENNLHAFVLERERDFSAALAGAALTFLGVRRGNLKQELSVWRKGAAA